MKKLILPILVAIGVNAQTPLASTIASMPKEALSQNEIRDLVHTREEEKLARDVYLTLAKKWNLRVFNSIANAESRHMDNVKILLDKYGIKDPVTTNSVGVFKDAKLQTLYNDLVKRGSISAQEALKVGALIEDLDIYDLKNALSRTNNQDVKYIYQNIQRGSRNHMRSFNINLQRYGATYTPKYISQSEYSSIVNSSLERGVGLGAGMGLGQGLGRGQGQGLGRGQGRGMGARGQGMGQGRRFLGN